MKGTVSISDTFSRFLKLEEENNLFQMRIKGHKFWDHMRYHVFENVYRFENENIDAAKRKNYLLLLVQFIYYGMIYMHGLLRTRRKYDIIFLDTTYYTNIIDGKEVNTYLYPIINRLRNNYKILLIEPFILPVSGKYHCDILRTRFLCLLNNIKSLFVIYDKEEKNIFSRIGSIIEDGVGVKIDVHALAKKIYSRGIVWHKQYLKLFKRYSPKMVAFCDNGQMKSLIEAARGLGIATVDLQHALVSDLNVLYRYPEMDGHISDIDSAGYLFTFGDFWNEEFRLPSTKMSIGFPYKEIIKKDVKPPKGVDRSKNIIFISDGYLSRKKSSEIAMRLSELLPNFEIYYKLRAAEYPIWRDRYPPSFSENPNIIVIDNNRHSLYEYFALCSYQIGINSTAIYEGMGFDLTAFILKTGYYEEMRRLYDDGYAFLVSSADEIAQKIKDNVKPKNRLDMKDVFKDGSLRNIEEAVRIVIAEKIPVDEDRRKRRGLLISPGFPPPFIGGSLVYVHTLLENSRYPFDILTGPLPPGQEEVTDKRHAVMRTSFITPSWHNPTRLQLLTTYLYTIVWFLSRNRSRRHDIVITHLGEFGNSILILLLKMLHVSVVVVGHGEDLTIPLKGKGIKNFIKRKLVKFTYKKADGFLANGNLTKRILASLGIPPEKIEVIFPGVNYRKLRGPQGGKKDIRGHRILSVGRLIAKKGFNYLIDAFNLLKGEIPNIELSIVGEGPDRDDLEGLIRRHGLEDRVFLKGRVSDQELHELYRHGDLFVLANVTMKNGDTEGFGIVFIEASAYGMPVIGGIDGGAFDAIADTVSGYLVDARNISKLAERMKKILLDPELAKRLGEAGWAKVKDEHEPAKIGQKFNGFIERMIDERMGPT